MADSLAVPHCLLTGDANGDTAATRTRERVFPYRCLASIGLGQGTIKTVTLGNFDSFFREKTQRPISMGGGYSSGTLIQAPERMVLWRPMFSGPIVRFRHGRGLGRPVEFALRYR